MVLNAKDAIAQHMRWRMIFQFAIECKEPIGAEDMAKIENCNQCPIGAWLISPSTVPFRQLPEYQNLVRAHVAFHREMTRLADSINRTCYDEAMYALGVGSPFQLASQTIAHAIMSFDRVRTIAIPK